MRGTARLPAVTVIRTPTRNMSERLEAMPSSQVMEPPAAIENGIAGKHAIGCPADREVIDRVVAMLALCVLSPLLLLVALAVLAGNGWPVFFRQERVGKAGKSFQLMKFRTMRVNKSGPSITARGDARITPTGRVLRKFKLDELPQL